LPAPFRVNPFLIDGSIISGIFGGGFDEAIEKMENSSCDF
jgi:hypothetical protein